MDKKRILALVALGVLLLIGALFWWQRSDSPNQRTAVGTTASDSETNTNDTSEQSASSPTQSLRIAAVGDMLPHDTVNLRAQSGDSYDYTPFFTNVASYLQDADIVFCNQESPSAGEEYGISGYPSFNAPKEFSRDLEKVGCNVINLANNHIADKGQDAINETLNTWDNLNPHAVSGANRNANEQSQVSYFEVEGRTIAFIAFTDLSNNSSIAMHAVNMFDETLVRTLAREAAGNADYVIASAHWGVEDSDTVTVGQESWAQLLADNGVDLIIGTGPHVLQPIDTIGDTTVIYSLGNFLSTQLTIEQLTGGIAYIDITFDDQAPSVSFLPTYMSYTWSAEEAAAENLLARNNLNLYPLDAAGSRIASSLFNTSADEQLERIREVLNRRQPVTILSSQ